MGWVNIQTRICQFCYQAMPRILQEFYTMKICITHWLLLSWWGGEAKEEPLGSVPCATFMKTLAISNVPEQMLTHRDTKWTWFVWKCRMVKTFGADVVADPTLHPSPTLKNHYPTYSVDKQFHCLNYLELYVYHGIHFLKVLSYLISAADKMTLYQITSNSFHVAFFPQEGQSRSTIISVFKDKGTSNSFWAYFRAESSKPVLKAKPRVTKLPSKSCSVFGFHLKRVTDYLNI